MKEGNYGLRLYIRQAENGYIVSSSDRPELTGTEHVAANEDELAALVKTLARRKNGTHDSGDK